MQMRRSKQQLTDTHCLAILDENTSGVLALSDENGYPYAVPLSYVVMDHKIYFHSALSGHKIDIIKQNKKASFCVINQDLVVPEKYTTHYKSVIVFGNVYIVEDKEEKMKSIQALCKKYHPTAEMGVSEEEIKKSENRFCMIALDITSMSGKQALELV